MTATTPLRRPVARDPAPAAPAPLLSARAAAMAPFLALETLVAANRLEAAGADILHLEIGQPGHPVPAPILAAMQAALVEAPMGYTESMGMGALRHAIALHYRHLHGVEVDPGRVIVTLGSSAALITAYLALFDAGDTVGTMSPGYPAYARALEVLGLRPRPLPIGPDSDFRLTREILERHGRGLDGLILSNPNNPTGTGMDADTVAMVVAWAEANGVKLVMDEIYQGIDHMAVPPVSALRYSDRVTIINGFSKYFGLTGFRLGWLVTPPELAPACGRIVANLFVAPPTLSQHGALAALSQPKCLEPALAAYRANRVTLLEVLRTLGFARVAPADGAFYLWVDIRPHGTDSAVFARWLLEDHGLAVTPGADFDPIDGHHYVRLSYAGTRQSIDRAAERLRTAIASLGGG